MSVVHTTRIRIEKHEGPHRTAYIEHFPEPAHFGIDCSWDAAIEKGEG
jgi:hypothetical protein